MDEVAWYQGNSDQSTHPVGSKRGNAWGLYDFSGNVWEWVWDWFTSDYEKLSSVDPMGPTSGKYRVNRGGSWVREAQGTRVAHRFRDERGVRGRRPRVSFGEVRPLAFCQRQPRQRFLRIASGRVVSLPRSGAVRRVFGMGVPACTQRFQGDGGG